MHQIKKKEPKRSHLIFAVREHYGRTGKGFGMSVVLGLHSAEGNYVVKRCNSLTVNGVFELITDSHTVCFLKFIEINQTTG